MAAISRAWRAPTLYLTATPHIAGARHPPMPASTLIFAPSLAGTVLSIAVAVIAGMRRSGPAWPWMVLLGVAVAWWCFGQTFWILADTPAEALRVNQVQYVGVQFAPLLWLLVALAQTGHRRWLRPWRVAPLTVVPLLTLAFAWSYRLDAPNWLWSGFHVVKAGATWLGGRLSDRLGRRPMVVAGWLLYAAVYLAFATVDRPDVLAGVVLAYGLYFGLTEPVERAWVVDLAPAARRGAALGLYHGAVGLAALPASVLFGLLWEWFGAPIAFAAGAGAALVATILLLGVGSVTGPRSARTKGTAAAI